MNYYKHTSTMVKFLTWPIIRSIPPFKYTYESKQSVIDYHMKEYHPKLGKHPKTQEEFNEWILPRYENVVRPLPSLFKKLIGEIASSNKIISLITDIKINGIDLAKWDSEIDHYNSCISETNIQILMLKAHPKFQCEMEVSETFLANIRADEKYRMEHRSFGGV
jgi:hypothetical protein